MPQQPIQSHCLTDITIMPPFCTPTKKILHAGNPSFSHHEAFARHLVEDTPPKTPTTHSNKRRNTPLIKVIKDHVLRNAHSFAARSTRSFAASDTLRPPSIDSRQFGGPILGEIDQNNQAVRPGSNRFRPSPCPSLKKRKAEQILKDHGSPPGLRVTAGGRIVPSDQSPLCSPRYGYSAVQKNGGLIRFAPNYPPPPSSAGAVQDPSRTLPNGFVAQDPHGRLLQIVDGQFLPINEINGIPQLYIAAPNLNSFPSVRTSTDNVHNPRGEDSSTGSAAAPVPGVDMKQPTLTVSVQIQALEKQYSKLEQESRDLDKVEVIQRSTMSPKAYQQLVQKRRELVSRLNEIRVSLKSLREQQKNSPEQTSPITDERTSPPQLQMPHFANLPVLSHGNLGQHTLPGWSLDGFPLEAQSMMPFHGVPMSMSPELGYYLPQPGAFAGQMPQYPHVAAPVGPVPPMFNMMGMQPAEMFHSFANVVNAAPQAFPNQVPVIPNLPRSEAIMESMQSSRRAGNDTASSGKSSPRRSRALEIKPPETKLEVPQGNKSALNPMSPSYQPSSVSPRPSTPKSKRTQATSPSPALAEAVRAHNIWVGETANATDSASSQRAFRYESSNASFATADFFPNNPRDHSSNKQAYTVAEDRAESAEKGVDEITRPTTDENKTANTAANTAMGVVVSSVEQQITIAPPGTPTDANMAHQEDAVSHRSQHNMSPKHRRQEFLPLTDHKSVGDVATTGCGPKPPCTNRATRERTESSSSRLPVSSSGSLYNEGFRCGEARLPVGPDKSGVWLDGYCAGLRATSSIVAEQSSLAMLEKCQIEERSDVKAKVGRSSQRSEGLDTPRPPFELNAVSLDTLKEAVFSSQNENAILSPDSSGATISETSTSDVGRRAKYQEDSKSSKSVLTQLHNGQTSFPERTSSMIQRQLTGPGVADSEVKALGDALQDVPASDGRRNFSVQSQPSNSSQASYFRTSYPGHRVLSSQLEWKSGSSIAQVAGLAHGYVAQFDGTLNDLAALGDMSPLTRMSGNSGTIVNGPKKTPKKQDTSPSAQTTRFLEGSLGADDNSGSPSGSPSRKSPTKTKFAHIAGKAGIKVRADEQSGEEGESRRESPREKHRWRELWRKGL